MGARPPGKPQRGLVRGKGRVGQVIAERYKIEQRIASGGFGAVYVGKHVHMGHRVAIKVLHPKAENLPGLVERFRREAIVGAHVRHPNVATAIDYGTLKDGSYYLVSEHADGDTLKAVLKQGPLTVERSWSIARQLAEALDATHSIGAVHRDVKPANIILVPGATRRDPDEVVKLIDFGFAKVAREKLASVDLPEPMAEISAHQLTMDGMVFGTVAYMPPEAFHGMDRVDERSDLYALGLIFYEMLTGRRPFVGETEAEVFKQKLAGGFPPLDREDLDEPVASALHALLERILHKDPDARFQTAHEVVDALDALPLAIAAATKPVSLSPDPKPSHSPASPSSEPSAEATPGESGADAEASESGADAKASESAAEAKPSDLAAEAKPSEPNTDATANEPPGGAEPAAQAEASESAGGGEPAAQAEASESAEQAEASEASGSAEPGAEVKSSEPAGRVEPSEPSAEAKSSEPSTDATPSEPPVDAESEDSDGPSISTEESDAEPAPESVTSAIQGASSRDAGVSERPPASRSRAWLFAVLLVAGGAGGLALWHWSSHSEPVAAPLPEPATHPDALAVPSASTSATPPAEIVVRQPSPEARAWIHAMYAAEQAKDWKTAFATFEKLARTEPSALAHPLARTSAADTFSALAQGRMPEADTMLKMLEGQVGSAGPEILFHVVQFQGGSRARDSALASLAKPEVRRLFSDALRLAVELREAGCDTPPALLKRAETEGESQVLLALKLQHSTCPPSSERDAAFRRLEARLTRRSDNADESGAPAATWRANPNWPVPSDRNGSRPKPKAPPP